MIILDELNKGLDIITKPRTATFRVMKVPQSFAFYYKFSIIPLLVIILVSFLFGDAFINQLTGLHSAVQLVEIIVGIVWVLIPIFIIINSVLYYALGRLLRTFNDFGATLTAVVYAQGPLVLFLWLTAFQQIAGIVAVMIGLWSIIVLIIGLSEQHNIRIKAAIATVVVGLVIEGAVVAGALYMLGFL